MTKISPNLLASRGSVLAALAALAWPMSVSAQNDRSASGSASAQVVRPIEVRQLEDLSFGSLSVLAGQSGSVSLPAGGGAAEYSGAVFAQCAGAIACSPHRATFIVKGEANRLYRLDLPSSVLVRGERTGIALTVTGLEIVSRNHPEIVNGGQLDNAGEDYSHVGGILDVPVGTPPDRFRADLSVTVSYN